MDELEANRIRTLQAEWRRVAESDRPDESRRAQKIADEARAAAQAEADERAERVRAVTEKSLAHLASRPEISAAEKADRRFRAAERRHAREEREREESAEVRSWIERRNREDNYRRSQPVATSRAAESVGDDGWDAWRRFVDGRIARYFEAHVEELIERKVEQRMLQIYKENHELATAVRKSIEAIAKALDQHAELIRELGKREDTGTRSSDISSRPLRVVN
jgi:hypothetical protein